MFIIDRTLENQTRVVKELGSQRHVPCLRASLERKNFGRKPGPKPFGDSYRSMVLNSSKKSPLALNYMDKLSAYSMDEALAPLESNRTNSASSSARRRAPLSAR